MIYSVHATDFASWRKEARRLLQAGIHPAQVLWNQDEKQVGLFPEDTPVPVAGAAPVSVPKDFLALAEIVSCHQHEERFNLLYYMLWRLANEEKRLLKISSDPLTHALDAMRKAVRRDVHKTKAFVRFRLTHDEDGEEHYIAWHKPDHRSLKLSAPFFARRFAIMRWTILTPRESVHWNGEALHYGPGATRKDAPQGDEMEALWKDFYRAIFNPARIKLKAMKREMPIRHWATMPETEIIADMLREAPERVERMIAQQEGYYRSAGDFIPVERDIASLREAARHCEGCELYRDACQTVFGEGPEDASMMLVGEQPGDEEDKAGKAFIGPAGKVLNRALGEAGIKREELYITNAVKHFKFRVVADKRYHRTPTLRDITGCKPWLEAELTTVKPKLVVCLGVSASRALISQGFTLKEGRGEPVIRDNILMLPTYHPSAVLRSDQAEVIFAALKEDLIHARELVQQACA